MKLQIYSNRISQPCRAVIIFCKLHGIEFDEINVSIAKGQQFTPEYKAMQFSFISLLHFLELQITGTFSYLYPQGAAGYVMYSRGASLLGGKLNLKAAAASEKVLSKSLAKIETFWLNGDGKFLLGNFQPTIADLSLVCELMQLELVADKDRDRILSPHKKVLQWIDDTKNATNPYFVEIHSLIFELKAMLEEVGESNETKHLRKTVISKL